MTAFVEYAREGEVVTIRLNRPERMNSLGRELVADLDAAWHDFSGSDARVAILTGSGRAFCSGMDVKEAAAGEPVEPVFPEPPLTVFHAGQVAKPVIAAVNGYAIGGGFFDVLRCDVRVAAESAVFQLAEVARSVLPNPLFEGIAGALPDCLVMELGLGGRIDARRAFEMGLVNRVVPDARLLATATAMANEIAQLPPLAVERVVGGLRRIRAFGRVDTDLLDWQRQADAELRQSEDYQEALRSFIEKREPVFKGR